MDSDLDSDLRIVDLDLKIVDSDLDSDFRIVDLDLKIVDSDLDLDFAVTSLDTSLICTVGSPVNISYPQSPRSYGAMPPQVGWLVKFAIFEECAFLRE